MNFYRQWQKRTQAILFATGFFGLSLSLALASGLFYQKEKAEWNALTEYENRKQVEEHLATREAELASTSASLVAYLSQDQYQINKGLMEEIDQIQKTFNRATAVYEDLNDLSQITNKTDAFEKDFATSLAFLSERKWASASAVLSELDKKLATEMAKVTAVSVPASAPLTQSNTPPTSGFQRQSVSTDVGTFTVSVVAADLNNTRVIVDTASDSDCRNDCPVLSLSDYISRNGAFAGVNGSYFCPASYPACADKKNSFDTLLMNKNKKYFNSDNNVYSTVPAVIFSGNSARFVGRSLEWGRDTGVDAVLANQPLLVSGGNVVFGGDGDPKKGSKSVRSFVGTSGSTVYIGVVHSATVAEAAHAVKALGIQNALNLDGGGSSALWSGGYKVGPGRALPNALLLVRK